MGLAEDGTITYPNFRESAVTYGPHMKQLNHEDYEEATYYFKRYFTRGIIAFLIYKLIERLAIDGN